MVYFTLTNVIKSLFSVVLSGLNHVNLCNWNADNFLPLLISIIKSSTLCQRLLLSHILLYCDLSCAYLTSNSLQMRKSWEKMKSSVRDNQRSSCNNNRRRRRREEKKRCWRRKRWDQSSITVPLVRQNLSRLRFRKSSIVPGTCNPSVQQEVLVLVILIRWPFKCDIERDKGCHQR